MAAAHCILEWRARLLPHNKAKNQSFLVVCKGHRRWKDAWMQPPASLRGAWLLHASFWSRYFPAHVESSIMRLLLSLAGGAHDGDAQLLHVSNWKVA